MMIIVIIIVIVISQKPKVSCFELLSNNHYQNSTYTSLILSKLIPIILQSFKKQHNLIRTVL